MRISIGIATFLLSVNLPNQTAQARQDSLRQAEQNDELKQLEETLRQPILFDAVDQTREVYLKAKKIAPQKNWSEIEVRLASAFNHLQRFGDSVEILQPAFQRELARRDRTPETSSSELFQLALAIVESAPHTNSAGIENEILDQLIAHLRLKTRSSPTPDSHSKDLVKSIHLRTRSLDQETATLWTQFEVQRTKQDAENNPDIPIAQSAYLAALKMQAFPIARSTQLDMEKITQMLSFADTLENNQSIHKIVWGLEYFDVVHAAIENLVLSNRKRRAKWQLRRSNVFKMLANPMRVLKECLAFESTNSNA